MHFTNFATSQAGNINTIKGDNQNDFRYYFHNQLQQINSLFAYIALLIQCVSAPQRESAKDRQRLMARMPRDLFRYCKQNYISAPKHNKNMISVNLSIFRGREKT